MVFSLIYLTVSCIGSGEKIQLFSGVASHLPLARLCANLSFLEMMVIFMKRIQIVMALLALSACSPKVDNAGYIRESDLKSQVSAGLSRDEVRTRLGSPSAQSTFGTETWYYVSSRKEATAFFKPEIVEQEVLRIEFNQAGVVTTVQAYDKEDAKQFDIAKRTTPTEGHQMGFIEQAIGNIGRFNAPGGRNSSAVPGRQPGQ
jgi:outer membrane protein assembly factor BamE (lipoprotein component of BamABCDE complex)